MPFTIIGDVHGQLFWKDIVEKRDGPVFFLGDYFDLRGDGPFALSQADNFTEICAYARANPDTILLLGNHDIQYMPGSRYGNSSFDRARADTFRHLLLENADIMQMVYVLRPEDSKPVIFSHAGVSSLFMEEAGLALPEDLNSYWEENPGEFDWHSGGSLRGDDPWQSPAWIRPFSLSEYALAGYDQIVGHTIVEHITKMPSENGNDDIWLTCTLNNEVLRLNDNGSFLEIWPQADNRELEEEGCYQTPTYFLLISR